MGSLCGIIARRFKDKSMRSEPFIDPFLNPRPVLKWAGGKQQLLTQLLERSPKRFNRYIEPFFGGGAFFFALRPERAIIADANPELMELYDVVAEKVEELIDILSAYKTDKETFYQVRAKDPEPMTPSQRAARLIFLNKTCFNGLYRVNREGRFNVPYGHHHNPRICRAEELRASSLLLKQAKRVTGDYKNVLDTHAREGDFVYLDPPYLPISKYSDFKRYTSEQFYEEDHVELAGEVRRLHEQGCHVLLSNSNHPLVYELYKGFKTEVFRTRRSISKIAAKRRGEDVLVSIPPRHRVSFRISPPPLNKQVKRFPPTRYMGSKQRILNHIRQVASPFRFDSVLDLFSGSGVVGYMFKTFGKQVFSNDFMAMSHIFSQAMVENNRVTLPKDVARSLLDTGVKTDGFVSSTFGGLYFSDEENNLIDCVRANIKTLGNKYQRAIALSALIRAALKKRPRGIFTYTGQRYDDGRRDLKTSLADHFLHAVGAVNRAIFDNGKKNLSRRGDAMTVTWKPDLVYMDPPYYSPFSDNDYVRRYHFLEGLACDWKGLTIQDHTKTKKFKSYPSPFSSRVGATDAFDRLLAAFRESILMISYSSNSLPGKEEMLSLLAKYKEHVEVVAVDYRYSFANQGHKVKANNNKVREYIFVAY